MIGIIDYNAGNIHSVGKALNTLGFKYKIVQKSSDISNVKKLIFPGVGNYGDTMKKISHLKSTIKNWIKNGNPLLGICVGLQTLMESSREKENITGLSFFKGKNEKFNIGKVPQIGWNKVSFKKDDPLFEKIEDNSYFYFLHSFYPVPVEEENILATTKYYTIFSSILKKDNVYGVQFHPEKSGILGIKLINNWINL